MCIMPESGEDTCCLVQRKQVPRDLPMIPTFEHVSTIDDLPGSHGCISLEVDGALLMQLGQVGIEHVRDMAFDVTLYSALGYSNDLHVLFMCISFDHWIIFVSSLQSRRAQYIDDTLDGIDCRPRRRAQANDSKLCLGRLQLLNHFDIGVVSSSLVCFVQNKTYHLRRKDRGTLHTSTPIGILRFDQIILECLWCTVKDSSGRPMFHASFARDLSCQHGRIRGGDAHNFIAGLHLLID